MSKRIAKPKKSRAKVRRAQRKGRKPLVIIGSLLILAVAIVAVAWLKMLPAASKPLALAPNPQAGSLATNSPSKEYVYSGGNLIATEEPTPSSSSTAPTPTPTPWPAPSNYRSLNPNGVWAEVPNSASLNITGPITVEAWIKPSGTTAVRGIVERYGINAGQGGYALRIAFGKLQFFTLGGGYSYDYVESSSYITVNTWHHVAGVFDGSQLRVYIDGVLDNTKASTFAPGTGDTNLFIGNTGWSTNNYAGLIDEARVTASAVYTNNFTPQTRLRALPNTKGMWKFDDENILDSSGQGNNGTLYYGGQYSTDVAGAGLETIWIEDQLPAGATPTGTNESWNWTGTNPSPASGALSHQSILAAGFHNHYFTGATVQLPVNAGDKLFTYIYLDPANMPAEVMLSFNDGTNWYHAYFGADMHTAVTRQYAGPLPGAGGWVRLEVPASLLGLEGKSLSGMCFTVWDGTATWDRAGKFAQGQ